MEILRHLGVLALGHSVTRHAGMISAVVDQQKSFRFTIDGDNSSVVLKRSNPLANEFMKGAKGRYAIFEVDGDYQVRKAFIEIFREHAEGKILGSSQDSRAVIDRVEPLGAHFRVYLKDFSDDQLPSSFLIDRSGNKFHNDFLEACAGRKVLLRKHQNESESQQMYVDLADFPEKKFWS